MAEPIEFVDVADLDRVYRRVTAIHDQEVLMDASRDQPIPEEYMTRLADFLDDGQSSVTVGGEVATNDFGNKASAYVSVRVACGTNEACIHGAHAIACEIKETLLTQDYDAMEAMLEDKLGAKKGVKEPSKPAVPADPRVPVGKPRPVNRRR